MNQEGYLEQGYHIDRYHALEDDLLRFLDFVTLDFYPSIEERQKVKSLYLGDLLLRIGSNIDIFFRKIIISNKDDQDFKEILGKRSRIDWNAFKKLEPILELSEANVEIISTSERLYPFRLGGKPEAEPWDDESVTLTWWNSYNKIKHEGLFDKATLDNVIQALAALFILILLDKLNYEIAEKLNRYGYISGFNYWIDRGVEIKYAARSRLFKEGDKILYL
jgi:hypothetical protein